MRALLASVRMWALPLILVLGAGGQVKGDLIVFQGIDPGVGPGGARPNSNAAAAAFDAAANALGGFDLITFEGLTLGNFSSRVVAPGVTASLFGTAGDANAGITNILGDATLGYNTTAGGSQHLRVVPDFAVGLTTATFTFDVPIQAFGAFFTGIGTVAGLLELVFDDGTLRTLTLPGAGNGGVQFFGFTDEGTAISSVTIRETRTPGSARDIFGIDDMRAGAVPEPASLTLLGLGAVSLLGYSWRRKRQA